MAGRPRSFDRETALNTAMEQFWRRGYEDTTVASLTQAMGIAAPSLYAAFGDKDQLFAEAKECYVANILASMEQAFAGVSAVQGLARVMRMTAAAHTDTATPLGCFVLTEPRLAGERELLRRRFLDQIRRGMASGELAPESDPDHLASFLLAVLAGMSERARDGAGAPEVQAIAELALAALPLVDSPPAATSPVSSDR